MRKPRQVKPKDKPNNARVSTAPARWQRKASMANSGSTSTIGFPSYPIPQATNGASAIGQVDAGHGPVQNNYSIPLHPRSLPVQPSIPNRPPPSPGFGVSWEQAEKAVAEFTNLFTAHLPFVILDHDITARRLCIEKPLLFRVILMIAIDFTASKSREIRRSVDAWIGQHVLVMEEQDIGVLQGLLVYILWASPHFYADKRATQLIYLAVGLAHSLGITRGAVSEDQPIRKESEINEEHRAFLTCYYVLSFNCFQFGRPNTLSSSYVQHCIDSLERSSEFASDFLLLKLVKFRQFINRVPTVYQGICDMKWCREISEDASEGLKQITKDLDDSMSDISHKHYKLLLLWNLHNSAIVQLHLPMTYVVPENETVSRVQLESMQHCLQAARAFIGRVISFSPDGMLYAPFTTLADLLSVIIAISRLLVVRIDGWDLTQARKSLDLKAMITELKIKMTTGSKVKAARLAEAAVANPSSYKPDGPGDEKHNRALTFMKLIDSVEEWLDAQGAFLPVGDESSEEQDGDSDEKPAPVPCYASPQSPQWSFTYYFESLLGIGRTLA
ncbi:hypothetical protein NPX13_g10142 [Xylaria arbuscula]|uniref:Transcription factor domain-containing protein n=1 Tax=Xylaria arbuscula TaxID=114810 RepID=A0A9W8TIC3_9PEZI|nr:hypothetical protein NPX13_g10142 [Xylaria arbuscula]